MTMRLSRSPKHHDNDLDDALDKEQCTMHPCNGKPPLVFKGEELLLEVGMNRAARKPAEGPALTKILQIKDGLIMEPINSY